VVVARPTQIVDYRRDDILHVDLSDKAVRAGANGNFSVRLHIRPLHGCLGDVFGSNKAVGDSECTGRPLRVAAGGTRAQAVHPLCLPTLSGERTRVIVTFHQTSFAKIA
jgi:hypothetical protein